MLKRAATLYVLSCTNSYYCSVVVQYATHRFILGMMARHVRGGEIYRKVFYEFFFLWNWISVVRTLLNEVCLLLLLLMVPGFFFSKLLLLVLLRLDWFPLGQASWSHELLGVLGECVCGVRGDGD